MINSDIFIRARKFTAFLLCIVLTAALTVPLKANAKTPTKTVCVGWYESPFNSTDSAGRRSGYAYEYQMKIAAYTGWEYSYVSGSWSELMQMMIDGKIDLMSDVSYTEERNNDMLFSELPMGTEEYCIFVSPKNHDITADNYSSLNNKRIGVNKDSVQAGFYRSWAKQHKIQAQLVELTCTETESIEMLNAGSLDAFITLNTYSDPEKLISVCKIGSSDFFFVVNKARPDLIKDLNAAMNRIKDENPYVLLRLSLSACGI